MTRTKTWTVELVIDEDEDETQAFAALSADSEMRVHGGGLARRNPHDPVVPEIGEELAAARALADLSRQLLGVAASAIEFREGRPVSFIR
ncbi:MAG TPA: dsRBD fold-containing protein [Acidimicrobiales bacterium]|nr:dsRBD fold-containing protein [Acidimicrobiales bacterium]